jgi:hypothetical protein
MDMIIGLQLAAAITGGILPALAIGRSSSR